MTTPHRSSLRRTWLDGRGASAAVVIGAAIVLGACASAPVPTLLTLQAGARTTPALPAAARAPFAIEILPVGMPARVDRTELVVTTNAGDVRVLDNLRWITPPGNELREAMAQRLAVDHGIADASGLRVAAGDVIRLRLMVRQFDTRLDDGSFAIDADWQATRPGDARPGPTCRFAAHVLAPSARPDAGAHRIAVTRWAEQLAGYARAWSARPDTPCP